MAERRQVDTIQLSSGQTMDASQAVCPTCRTLDLDTDFEHVDVGRWRLTCPLGHQWVVTVPVPTGDGETA
jgi:hypothetical protein